MIEQLIWRFLEYRKRKQAVIIGTIITGLVAVWPAADEYMAARERVREAQSTFEDSEQQVAKREQFEQLYQKRTSELKKLESQAVDEKTAQNLRNELMHLVRETGCKMRRIRLGDPLRRDWTEKDSPVDNVSLTDRGGETPFQLITRQMSISITGSMSNVNKFLGKLNQVDRLIHTKSISLKRSNGRSETSLDMDLFLFDLPLKPTT